MSLDLLKIRSDFPCLKNESNNTPIYFYNACVTLRPNEVIEAGNKYYYEHPSCHQRSIHQFGKKTTDAYLHSRNTVKSFLNAKKTEEIIFVKNTTEGINLIANGLKFKKDDKVLTTNIEHNSNLIPWQIQINKNQIQHLLINTNNNGINFEDYKNIFLKNRIKLVSVFHTSNVIGITLPIEEMVKIAHENGALFFLDAAQSITNHKIDVQKLDVDFLAFSFHKAFGSSGVGVLYGKYEHLQKIEPLCYGGESVVDANYSSFTFSDIPYRFEAGLQNYSGVMAGAQALRFIQNLNQDNILKHELKLNKLIINELKKNSKVKFLGPIEPELRPALINFYIDQKDMSEISILLDQSKNIMTRSGFHCCHSWYHSKNLNASLRASFSIYNTEDEALIFIDFVNQILKYF